MLKRQLIHGKSKIFITSNKSIPGTNISCILRLSNFNTLTNAQHYLLTSLKDNDANNCASSKTIDSVTQTTQMAEINFILHFVTSLLPKSCSSVNNKA